METDVQLQLDAFEVTLRDIAVVGIDQLHALSVAVGWPHRESDWRMLLDLGRGIAAVDEIGRVVGSVMWFRYAPDFVKVGMLITSPRLQEQGAGRWLMQRVHELNKGSVFGLTATRAAKRLYRSLGYGHEQKVLQCQGRAVVPADVRAVVAGSLRPVRPADHDALLDLDRAAVGCDRSAMFRRLLPLSTGHVLVRNGETVAFALCRQFGRGHVIGPVIAATEEDAIAVAMPHVEAHAGGFLRADTPAANAAFTGFLAAAGMQVHDTLTSMGLGRAPFRPASADGPRRMALASHTLG